VNAITMSLPTRSLKFTHPSVVYFGCTAFLLVSQASANSLALHCKDSGNRQIHLEVDLDRSIVSVNERRNYVNFIRSSEFPSYFDYVNITNATIDFGDHDLMSGKFGNKWTVSRATGQITLRHSTPNGIQLIFSGECDPTTIRNKKF